MIDGVVENLMAQRAEFEQALKEKGIDPDNYLIRTEPADLSIEVTLSAWAAAKLLGLPVDEEHEFPEEEWEWLFEEEE